MSLTWANRIFAVLGDIKIAHTVFALPFALLAAHLAFMKIGGYRIDTLIAILVCMFTARTAAMSFNRYIDKDIDGVNPRTSGRSIPSGRARPIDALAVVIVCSLIFLAACWYLGKLPFILSIPTLIVILGYSTAKRYTSMTHLWLGLSLSIAPTGAWIAVTGTWSWLPVILSVAVIFWVAAFDIIYSLQDVDFDRENRIFSVPALIGEPGAMWVARGMHLVSWIAMAVFGLIAGLGWPYIAAVILIGILLVVEHAIAAPGDFRKIGIAFFTMNGIISIVLYLSVLIASMLGTIHMPEGI